MFNPSPESHRSGRCRAACTVATALILVLAIILFVIAAIFVPPAISSYIHRKFWLTWFNDDPEFLWIRCNIGRGYCWQVSIVFTTFHSIAPKTISLFHSSGMHVFFIYSWVSFLLATTHLSIDLAKTQQTTKSGKTLGVLKYHKFICGFICSTSRMPPM